MLGAIIGDCVGSAYEGTDGESVDAKALLVESSRPTDESVLLCATAEAVTSGAPFDDCYRKWYEKYPSAGYGPGFISWVSGAPIGSFGNGAASRASVIGELASNEDEVLILARKSAQCSHDHPEAIAGAQAAALTSFLVRRDVPVQQIIARLYEDFDYLLFYDDEQLFSGTGFDASAINTVPLALYIGLTSDSFEGAMLRGLRVGGDTDTILSIAGSILEGRRGIAIPDWLIQRTHEIVSQFTPDCAPFMRR